MVPNQSPGLVFLAGNQLIDRLPPLTAGTIQLVWLAVDLNKPCRPSDLAVLTTDELARAERFKVERPRQVFVAGRAMLRRLLARHHRCQPEEVHFSYTDKGKPMVAGLAFSFNLSNSGATVAAAVVPGKVQLGVDVEELRPLRSAERLAERFFAPAEARAVVSSARDDLERAFFRVWTGKEAYLKAVGSGIAVPLDEFEVEPDLEQPPSMVRIYDDATAGKSWTLLDGELPERACTIAAAGQGWTLERFLISR